MLDSFGNISLSRKQSLAWHYLENDNTREVFFGGGAGSGKSMLGCLWHINRRLTYAGTRGFIGRSIYPSLRDSTMKTFFDVAGALGLTEGDDYTMNHGSGSVAWSNGSETHFRHMQKV